jgi:hypothetical protein
MMTFIIIGGSIGLLMLLCGGIGVVGMLMDRGKPDTAKASQPSTIASNRNAASSPVTTASSTPATTRQTPAPKTTPPRVEPTTGVTKANFNRLSSGMTYAQVVQILGSEGEILSESDVADINTVMYQWSGGGWANMNAMFQNGKLVSKAQFGLE